VATPVIIAHVSLITLDDQTADATKNVVRATSHFSLLDQTEARAQAVAAATAAAVCLA
jgi:hypothetical protein